MFHAFTSKGKLGTMRLGKSMRQACARERAEARSPQASEGPSKRILHDFFDAPTAAALLFPGQDEEQRERLLEL